MLWRISLISTIFLVSVHAELLPERFGNYNRIVSKPAPLTDRAVWDEYGFDSAERAVYKSGANQLTATAYRLKDPTGALAAFQCFVRPMRRAETDRTCGTRGCVGSAPCSRWATISLSFEGNRPSPMDLKQIFVHLPKFDHPRFRPWGAIVPGRNLVTNSERYILGPESLQKFEPRIPPSTGRLPYGGRSPACAFQDQEW